MKNSAAATSSKFSLFGEVLSPFRQAVELIHPHLYAVEERICEQARLFDPNIEGYIDYVAAKGGKRLRPALALLAGGATGKITVRHVDLAVILELIHIATLVHDDIIDGAQLRRDQPTANAKWSNAISVLLGDCLFAHALRLSTHFSSQEISRKIAHASVDVCSGEIIQTQRCFDLDLKITDYYRIIEMKTATLFAIACELGAFISEANSDVIDALRQFGHRLGIAYQIYDDCLDLVGKEAQVGKTLGTDLAKGKFTLPVLLMLHEEKEKQGAILRQLLIQREKRINVEVIIQMVCNSSAIEASSQTARQWIGEAREFLKKIPPNRYVLGLDAVASHLELVLKSLK